MGHQRPVMGRRIREIYAADFPIEGIVKERRSATRHGILAIVCIEMMLFAIYRTYNNISEHSYFWALVPGVGALILGIFAWDTAMQTRVEFLKAYRKFYLRRYVSALDTLEAEGYNWKKIDDKNALSYWEFYWSKDLKQFEQALFDYLRSFRRAEDLFRRQRRWAATNNKLTAQLEVLLDEFYVSDDERLETLDYFSSYDNPERRKEVLASVRTRLTHEKWQAMQQLVESSSLSGSTHVSSEMVNNLESEEDFRLKQLEKEASKVTSNVAQSLYRQGLTTGARHEKIRFFKRALNEDVHSAADDGEVAAAMATISKAPDKAAVTEVKYLSLQDFARERLSDIAGVIPPRTIDWQMRREVVLALARPGQSGGRFNKHYFAEDTVKRIVRRQCNMYGDIQFNPTAFSEAVSWLLKNGVLVTKPKVDERTLSISTNVKNATPEGAHVISLILRLKREMSGLPS